jgi:hypothetical protein
MIAYLKGGNADGSAKQVNKKVMSLYNELPDGSREWYNKTGRWVGIKADKETVKARLFRFDRVVPPKVRLADTEVVATVPAGA